MPGCATPAIPKVDDEEVLAYLKAENAYFEAAMAPHQPLVDTLFEEMRGRIKEDDSSVPVKDGDWLYWWAFRPARNIEAGTAGRSPAAPDAADLRRAGRGRGQGIFPPRRARGQPRRPARRDLVDDNGSERFKLRIRDLATGEDIETVTEVGIGQPVWTERQPGRRLHRGQRASGAATAPATTGSAAGRRGRHALRGDRGARLLGRRRPLAGPQPDLHRHRRQRDQRGPLRPRRRPDRAADPDLAAPGRSASIGRCRARQAVDPDQRRPCQFPPRRGRSGRARANGRR